MGPFWRARCDCRDSGRSCGAREVHFPLLSQGLIRMQQDPVTHEHETLAPQDDSYDLAIDPACLAPPAIIYRRLCFGHGEAKTITY